MRVEENVQRFRTALLMNLPFYGEIIQNIPFYADNSIQTAQTDGLSVRYSPQFFKTLNKGQQNYVLMHEVMHILLKHSKQKNRRHDLWNAACDMVVNQMLDQRIADQIRPLGIPFERPLEGIFTNSRSALSADYYYEQLLKLNKDKPKGNKVRYTFVKRPYAKDGTETIEVSAPNDLPLEVDMADTGPELEAMIRQALASSEKRGRGTTGSFYIPEQVIEIARCKPLPWKVLLKNLMNEVEDDSDSSWTTPERKYIHMDLLLPGHCRTEATELGEVWAFIDSSGSISRDELSRFLNEMWHLLHEFHCVLNIAYWDTAVTDIYTRIDRESKLQDCMPKHSGGTDINCVYQYMADKKLKPEVLLILTDGAFGSVRDEKMLRSLRDKTVMVLSTIADPEQFKKYGRVAAL